MRIKYILLVATLGLLSFASCKEESSKAKEVVSENSTLSKEEKKQVASVMTKAMATPELKTFVSASVTTGLYETLSKGDGPYTVLAPTNSAFKAISEEKMKEIQHADFKDDFATILKSHIVSDKISSAELLQSIKANNGSFTLHTLSGGQLSASLDNDQIIIKDENGLMAKLGKTDIMGDNGVVHLIDKVLVKE